MVESGLRPEDLAWVSDANDEFRAHAFMIVPRSFAAADTKMLTWSATGGKRRRFANPRPRRGNPDPGDRTSTMRTKPVRVFSGLDGRNAQGAAFWALIGEMCKPA